VPQMDIEGDFLTGIVMPSTAAPPKFTKDFSKPMAIPEEGIEAAVEVPTGLPSQAKMISALLLILGTACYAVGLALMFGLGMGFPGTVLLFLSTPMLVAAIPHSKDLTHIALPTLWLATTMLVRAITGVLGRMVPNIQAHGRMPKCMSRAPLWGSMLGAWFELWVTLIAVMHLKYLLYLYKSEGASTASLLTRIWKTAGMYMAALGVLCGQVIIGAAAVAGDMYGANDEFVPPTVVGLTLIVCAVFLLWRKLHMPVRQWLMVIGGMALDDDSHGADMPNLPTPYKIVICIKVVVALVVGFAVTAWLAAPAQAACK